MMNNAPDVSLIRIITAIVIGLLYITGAWLIGRFNRKGIILISIGLLLGLIEWIGRVPGLNDVIFAVVTVMALVYAWRDLAKAE